MAEQPEAPVGGVLVPQEILDGMRALLAEHERGRANAARRAYSRAVRPPPKGQQPPRDSGAPTGSSSSEPSAERRSHSGRRRRGRRGGRRGETTDWSRAPPPDAPPRQDPRPPRPRALVAPPAPPPNMATGRGSVAPRPDVRGAPTMEAAAVARGHRPPPTDPDQTSDAEPTCATCWLWRPDSAARGGEYWRVDCHFSPMGTPPEDGPEGWDRSLLYNPCGREPPAAVAQAFFAPSGEVSGVWGKRHRTYIEQRGTLPTGPGGEREVWHRLLRVPARAPAGTAAAPPPGDWQRKEQLGATSGAATWRVRFGASAAFTLGLLVWALSLLPGSTAAISTAAWDWRAAQPLVMISGAPYNACERLPGHWAEGDWGCGILAERAGRDRLSPPGATHGLVVMHYQHQDVFALPGTYPTCNGSSAGSCTAANATPCDCVHYRNETGIDADVRLLCGPRRPAYADSQQCGHVVCGTGAHPPALGSHMSCCWRWGWPPLGVRPHSLRPEDQWAHGAKLAQPGACYPRLRSPHGEASCHPLDKLARTLVSTFGGGVDAMACVALVMPWVMCAWLCYRCCRRRAGARAAALTTVVVGGARLPGAWGLAAAVANRLRRPEPAALAVPVAVAALVLLARLSRRSRPRSVEACAVWATAALMCGHALFTAGEEARGSIAAVAGARGTVGVPVEVLAVSWTSHPVDGGCFQPWDLEATGACICDVPTDVSCAGLQPAVRLETCERVMAGSPHSCTMWVLNPYSVGGYAQLGSYFADDDSGWYKQYHPTVCRVRAAFDHPSDACWGFAADTTMSVVGVAGYVYHPNKTVNVTHHRAVQRRYTVRVGGTTCNVSAVQPVCSLPSGEMYFELPADPGDLTEYRITLADRADTRRFVPGAPDCFGPAWASPVCARHMPDCSRTVGATPGPPTLRLFAADDLGWHEPVPPGEVWYQPVIGRQPRTCSLNIRAGPYGHAAVEMPEWLLDHTVPDPLLPTEPLRLTLRTTRSIRSGSPMGPPSGVRVEGCWACGTPAALSAELPSGGPCELRVNGRLIGTFPPGPLRTRALIDTAPPYRASCAGTAVDAPVAAAVSGPATASFAGVVYGPVTSHVASTSQTWLEWARSHWWALLLATLAALLGSCLLASVARCLFYLRGAIAPAR
nr:structural polyprotein [Rustrela virus]